MTDEFSEKTNQLLDYIEKTYLKVKIVPYQLPNYLTVQDMALDHLGDRLVQKMRLDTTQKVMIIFKNLKKKKKKTLHRRKPWTLGSTDFLLKGLPLLLLVTW